MLDRGRLLSKVEELEGHVRQLEELSPATPEEHLRDHGRRLACERLLQVCIECLLDIGEMFVSALRLGLPDDERGMVRRLGEAGVLGEEEVRLLKDMHAFRNILVHGYARLDHGKVFANLRRAPRDFRHLASAFRAAADAMAGK